MWSGKAKEVIVIEIDKIVKVLRGIEVKKMEYKWVDSA